MSRIGFRWCSALMLGIAAIATQAADPVRLEGKTPSEPFPGARFDPSIPTQQATLGFEPGRRPLRHDELMRYLEALDEASPRAVMQEYAQTHEGRRMVMFVVGDEATVSRLDDARQEHARRMDPRGRAAAEDQAALADAKAVAWMAYGIHGDELSSVDAAAALAYWLVAGEDDVARKLRQELIVVIDPCENPDGRDRFLAQTRSFAHKLPNPDTDDLSHTTVWPWGRGNHYLFDLNRDWFSMVHPESRRSAEIAGWNPQLMVDSHEMGPHDTYLLSPPRHPFNPHLPDYQWAWADRYAADQARALDARGYSYYTREWNEEFFPGYGSSWASYLGAIGILYEMSSTEGTLVRQRPGTLRTYAEAVEHQVASSIANLTTLAENRVEALTDFVGGRRSAIEQGRRGPVGAWVFPEGRYPERTRKLVGLLRDQGIEVLASEGPSPQAAGLRDARTGAVVDASGLRGPAWMVPVDQPAGALVRVILDPHVPMEAPFLREEREYQERGRGTRLYETTAWSLPFSYGIEAYWTARRPTTGWKDQPVPVSGSKLVQTEQPMGYLLEGTSDASVAALAEFLQQGLAVRVAGKPFRVEEQSYDRGTLLIKREGNPDDLEEHLQRAAERLGLEIRAVSTARASKGPDLGGQHFRPLVAPRVGILSGAPVAPSSYGALWHLFDEVLELRFSGLDVSRFHQTDLSRYNVLVFPPTFGGPGAYRELLGESGLKALKSWIEGGGTAVGLGGGADFLADAKTALTEARLRRDALDRYPPAVLGPSAEEVLDGGAFHASGVRPPVAVEDGDDKKKAKSVAPKRESLYDVAPILGAGARPFAAGYEQGTPVSMEPVALSEWIKPLLPAGKAKPDPEELTRADARLRRFATRGTFLRVELDPEIWLAWGMPDEVPALSRTSSALVGDKSIDVAARFADVERLHLGGLLWPETAARLAHTAYVTREGLGRGQVILFANEPEFRGWTLGTRRLLTNAILYGPGLGTSWSNPW